MRALVVICILMAWQPLSAQSSLSAEFVGLTIHPTGDEMAHLQPNRLDRGAHFVMNYGAAVSFEKYFVGDVLAVRVMQAVAADCSAGWASVSQAGLKAVVLQKPKHRMGLAIGPAFMFRESWSRFEGYTSSGFLREGHSDLFGPIQYKFFPLVAELEYEYRINDHWDFAVSMTPTLPMAMTLAAGFKFWFNKEVKEKIYLPKIK